MLMQFVTLAFILTWRCRATSDGPFCGASLFYVSCVPSVAKYQLQCSSRSLWHSFFLDWITATASCLDSLLTLSSVSNLSERCGSSIVFRIRQSEHIIPALISLHYGCASQNVSPSNWQLTYRSIHGTSPSYLQVMFHPCCRHDIQTTAAVFYHTSSGHSARSSVYSRQAAVSGFWCHHLERPASPRHICAVTRGFKTTIHDIYVFPFLYQDTITWLMCY